MLQAAAPNRKLVRDRRDRAPTSAICDQFRDRIGDAALLGGLRSLATASGHLRRQVL
jgi:hypothetical protein